MAKAFAIGLDLAHKFFNTARNAGFTAEEVGELAQEEHTLAQMASFVKGESEINAIERFIDCNTAPTLPNHKWRVETHRKHGRRWRWSPLNVELILSKNQQSGRIINGESWREEVSSEHVLNANVLDYLLTFPALIPRKWRKKDYNGYIPYIFFWGTIFIDENKHSYVRYLFIDRGLWKSGIYRLDHKWNLQRNLTPVERNEKE